jgi:hypothetical protein
MRIAPTLRAIFTDSHFLIPVVVFCIGLDPCPQTTATSRQAEHVSKRDEQPKTEQR